MGAQVTLILYMPRSPSLFFHLITPHFTFFPHKQSPRTFDHHDTLQSIARQEGKSKRRQFFVYAPRTSPKHE